MQKMSFYLTVAVFFIFQSFASAAATETSMTQSQAIKLAKHTLAKHKKVSIDKLQLESAKLIQWPDSSLGCPQPGMMYAQVITPGYQVTLLNTASGKLNSVHIGNGSAVVCEKTASTRSQTEKNLRFGKRLQQTQKAKKLLADRLSLSLHEIRVLGSRSITGNSPDISCKQKPADSHLQVIELTYKKKSYRYAVINDQLVFCD